MFCTAGRFCHPKAHLRPPLPPQIQSSVTPHAIVVLPKTDGMEMLLCYEDEGVYVNTYGRITKDVVLQWGEMPTSVGRFGCLLHTKAPLLLVEPWCWPEQVRFPRHSWKRLAKPLSDQLCSQNKHTTHYLFLFTCMPTFCIFCFSLN